MPANDNSHKADLAAAITNLTDALARLAVIVSRLDRAMPERDELVELHDRLVRHAEALERDGAGAPGEAK